MSNFKVSNFGNKIIRVLTYAIFDGPKRSNRLQAHSVADLRGPRGCVAASGPVLERYARSKGPSPNRRNLTIDAPGE